MKHRGMGQQGTCGVGRQNAPTTVSPGACDIMMRMRRRTLLLTVLAALAAASPARADLAQLKAACQPAKAEDAPAYTYRFCDDGVPDQGGGTLVLDALGTR
jgi:hypothetical protein